MRRSAPERGPARYASAPANCGSRPVEEGACGGGGAALRIPGVT
jgi:hypothetical protein